MKRYGSVIKLKPEKYEDYKRLHANAWPGGFVFNTVHNILPDVAPENIMAMFEAIDEYR